MNSLIEHRNKLTEYNKTIQDELEGHNYQSNLEKALTKDLEIKDCIPRIKIILNKIETASKEPNSVKEEEGKTSKEILTNTSYILSSSS